MVDAESFYQTMSKPEPPADERLLAVEKLIASLPEPAAQRGPDAAELQARRFYGHQNAQDRVEPSGRENFSRNQRPLQRLLTGLTSMRSSGRLRRTGSSACMATCRTATVSDTTNPN